MAIDAYGNAIASVESGGRYDLVGPTHPRYGRALGRYQVMESNLPTWLREAGLPAMSAEQFLGSREAQDALFNHRFGQYVQRYGPEGAARAWFAGEGGMNDPGRRDSLGTSVAEYSRRFMSALGGPPPAQAADPNAAPAAEPVAQTPPATTGQDVQSIVAEMLGQQRPAQQQRDPSVEIASAAAADIEPLRLPSMAPRRPVTTQQIRAGLARRIGV
jgi:hypothetical protein